MALVVAAIAVLGPARAECPDRNLLILPDGGAQFDGVKTALKGKELRAEIEKMAASPCPPFIRVIGLPGFAGPILSEFRRAGYKMQNITLY